MRFPLFFISPSTQATQANIPSLSHRALFSLPRRTRAAAGIAFFAWGVAGLYLSDHAGAKLGEIIAEEEAQKGAAGREPWVKISVVERGER